jgi:cystathionine beta-lyase
LKTLALRVKQINTNALHIAQFLEKHPKVNKVFYPGLQAHDGHQIAKGQMKGFGGMLSFELKVIYQSRLFFDMLQGNVDLAQSFASSLKLILPAVSLGGVETIICFPCETSHAKLSPEERQKIGISEQLIRMSVGIEDIEDLLQDIEQALV